MMLHLSFNWHEVRLFIARATGIGDPTAQARKDDQAAVEDAQRQMLDADKRFNDALRKLEKVLRR